MFGLPEKYKVNQNIDVKTFIKKELTTSDKKRLRETLKSVKLAYQLMGEEIPSIINDEYNCQVILFLEIEMSDIKNATFVANIIQEEIKPLCVIKLYDGNKERYSFAEKRLNLQDERNIIIENMFITKESSRYFEETWAEKLQETLEFNNVILKENKLFLYREMMIKAYIISELNLNTEGNKLLQSNLWFNSRKANVLFEILKEIDKEKLQLKKASDLREKSRVNGSLKSLKERIEKLV